MMLIRKGGGEIRESPSIFKVKYGGRQRKRDKRPKNSTQKTQVKTIFPSNLKEQKFRFALLKKLILRKKITSHYCMR